MVWPKQCLNGQVHPHLRWDSEDSWGWVNTAAKMVVAIFSRITLMFPTLHCVQGHSRSTFFVANNATKWEQRAALPGTQKETVHEQLFRLHPMSAQSVCWLFEGKTYERLKCWNQMLDHLSQLLVNRPQDNSNGESLPDHQVDHQEPCVFCCPFYWFPYDYYSHYEPFLTMIDHHEPFVVSSFFRHVPAFRQISKGYFRLPCDLADLSGEKIFFQLTKAWRRSPYITIIPSTATAHSPIPILKYIWKWMKFPHPDPSACAYIYIIWVPMKTIDDETWAKIQWIQLGPFIPVISGKLMRLYIL